MIFQTNNLQFIETKESDLDEIIAIEKHDDNKDFL